MVCLLVADALGCGDFTQNIWNKLDERLNVGSRILNMVDQLCRNIESY